MDLLKPMTFSLKMSDCLTGCGVWVTRPAHLAEGLCKAIELYGGKVLLYPTLVIQPCIPVCIKFSQVQQIIVTSQSAAKYLSKNRLQQLKNNQKKLTILAVGPTTKAFLNHLGLHVHDVPSVVGSEDLLLKAPTLQKIAHQSIVLLTGKDGLSLLEEGLKARGATVIRLETYERQAPLCFAAWKTWQTQCHAITLGSVAALDHAYACLPNADAQKWLQSLTGFVGSARMLQEVTAHYPKQCFQLAKSPHNADLIEAIKCWWRSY